ncbi:MAG: DMT family transporter [Clostridiales bacterium]|nr:DMT family transporter [Clostridiales bacterium]
MKLSISIKKIIILLGVVGVSFSAVLVKSSTAPSMVLVFYRMLIAAAILTVPALLSLRKEKASLTARNLICCLISGFFLALHFTAYFESIQYTSIASSVLLVDTEVFFVSFVMMFFFHEKISRQGWIGIIITFLGSGIVALGDAGGGTDLLRGDIIALLGAAAMSVYTIMGKICRKTMTTTLYTTIVYWIAALTTLVFMTLRHTPITGYPVQDYLIAGGMAILCTLLGHSIFSWGLKYVEASFISTAKLMEPVFASILGIIFFFQLPSITAILGGILIIFGIYLVGSFDSSKNDEAAAKKS